MPKHAQTPWEVSTDGRFLQTVQKNGRIIARNIDEADAARIAACVNACEGIEDPRIIPELLDICKRVARSSEASEALKKSASNTFARATLRDWSAQ